MSNTRFWGLALVLFLSFQAPTCDQMTDYLGLSNHAAEDAAWRAAVDEMVAKNQAKGRALQDARAAVPKHDLAAVDRAIAAYPDNSEIRFHKAALLVATGNFAQADVAANQGSARHPFGQVLAVNEYAQSFRMVRDSYAPGSVEYQRTHAAYCAQLSEVVRQDSSFTNPAGANC